MKPGEIRDRSDAELAKLEAELEEEVFRLRFKLGSGQLKQTSAIRKARRDLARVKTIMRERRLARPEEKRA